MVGDGTSCTCDQNGTFAMRTEVDIQWDPVTVPNPFGGTITVLAGGSDTTYSWSIVKQTVSGTTLTTDTTPCGATSPDICSPYYKEAYAETTPLGPVSHATSTAQSLKPGGTWTTPVQAALAGVRLTNPTGAWPTAWNAAGLTWVDDDGDGNPGITATSVNTGTSASCGYPYADVPLPSNPSLRVAKAFTGARVLASLAGTVVDCSTLTGNYDGPSNGFPEVDGRVRGCVLSDGTACSQAQFESLDSNAGSTNQKVLGSTFTMVRVADTTTCAQVLKMTFP
jgi:hypothetical protein